MSARTSIVDVECCSRGEPLAGEVPVVNLSRLLDAVAKPEGTLVYEIAPVRFVGKPAAQVSVQGRLWHTCQRCLGDFETEVSAQRILVFSPPPADLEEEGEATDFVGADARFEAQALVEEEALLSLPMVPWHPLGQCQADGAAGLQVSGSGSILGRQATEEH